MEQIKENKMGYLPCGRLIFSMGLPIMISMLIQALYNIVDSIYVARYSASALTAVSLAFPIQSLMIALGAGTGVGVNSLLSKRLGQKRFKEASDIAKTSLILAAVYSVLFLVLGISFSSLFFSFQTADLQVQKDGAEYLSIICVFSFGLFYQFALERLMQATGNAFLHMIVQGFGAIVNIILDPIFIFGYFGLSPMGTKGAAIATVVGQIAAMLLALILNLLKNKEISLSFRSFKFSWETVGKIYKVGFPAIIMQSIASVMVFLMNKLLLPFSSYFGSVLGVYFKVQSFIFMPVFGLTNGFIPIVAYNYGAKHKERILRCVKIATLSAVSIMVFGTLLFQLFPSELMMLFDPDETMLRMGSDALRAISLSFIMAGVNIVYTSFFQAVGKGTLSLICSIVRQLVCILPASYVLAITLGVDYSWYAFPIAEVVALFMSVVYFKIIKKNKIDPIPSERKA